MSLIEDDNELLLRQVHPKFIIEVPIPDKSHALINFSRLSSESRVKAAAKQLTAKARDRACLYNPEESSMTLEIF